MSSTDRTYLSGAVPILPIAQHPLGSMHCPEQQQPPLLQPGPAQFSMPPGSYNQHRYLNGLNSPQSADHQVFGSMGGQGDVLPLQAMPTGYPTSATGEDHRQGFDPTGQIAPPGMKPRVTATLWEDEGSLCFQVEAKGVCVARREGKPT
jgi:enhanced filamentous growth protein 1